MARINRRTYATRRKRSPNKMFAPGGMTPSGRLPGRNNESFRKGAGEGNPQQQSMEAPPYLNDQKDEAGIGGDKTYTIKEVE